MPSPLTRRTLLAGSAALPALAATPSARADTAAQFAYAVTRSDAEWREKLGADLFAVMRRGKTELPHSSDLVEETGTGTYCCKGCDLPIYASRWKRQLDKGWVFFRHSEPDAMLMSIDRAVSDDAIDATPQDRMALDDEATIEVHCRRCGSHIGHILIIEGELLHCSNGTALEFQPTEV